MRVRLLRLAELRMQWEHKNTFNLGFNALRTYNSINKKSQSTQLQMVWHTNHLGNPKTTGGDAYQVSYFSGMAHYICKCLQYFMKMQDTEYIIINHTINHTNLRLSSSFCISLPASFLYILPISIHKICINTQAESLGTKILDEDGLLELIRTKPGKKSKYEIAAEAKVSSHTFT